MDQSFAQLPTPEEDRKKTIFQFFYTLARIPRSIRFIREERLWEGLLAYGWLTRFLLFAGLVVGLGLFKAGMAWYETLVNADTFSIWNVADGLGSAASTGYEFFTDGAFKYVLLILMEVVTYHFIRRTLITLCEIEDHGTELQDFIRAQIRMIKIVIRSYVLELIARALLGVFFGIFGFLGFIEPIILLVIECFFLGYAIVDNYHEQFGLTIKQSEKRARTYIGIVMAVGLILLLLLKIPLLGSLAGPIVASVLASITLVELSDLKSPVTVPDTDG